MAGITKDHRTKDTAAPLCWAVATDKRRFPEGTLAAAQIGTLPARGHGTRLRGRAACPHTQFMNQRQKNVPRRWAGISSAHTPHRAERSLVCIIRCICVAYWLLLTTLLLAPLELFGIMRIPGSSGGFGVHFVIFAVLGGLVAACRFPLRSVLLTVLLVAYATATELLQGLVPTRECTLRDLLENLLGLAAGTAIWWGVHRCLVRTPKEPQ